jgi:hypothetical protein
MGRVGLQAVGGRVDDLAFGAWMYIGEKVEMLHAAPNRLN